MEKTVKKDIETLWEYLCLKKEPEKAECIIGLGSILESVPTKCAELYKSGFGNYILFSGNCGKGTEGVISKTEAEFFKGIAIQEGVFEDKILIEKENLHPKSFLIVGKPYQERRAQSIAKIELANSKFSIASFSTCLDEFIEYVVKNYLMSVDDVINEVVAEVNIGIITPKYGIQQKEELPKEVLESYERLCEKGYTKYLVTDDLIDGTRKKWKAIKLI